MTTRGAVLLFALLAVSLVLIIAGLPPKGVELTWATVDWWRMGPGLALAAAAGAAGNR